MVLAFVRLEEQGHDLVRSQTAIIIDRFDNLDVAVCEVKSQVLCFGFDRLAHRFNAWGKDGKRELHMALIVKNTG